MSDRGCSDSRPEVELCSSHRPAVSLSATVVQAGSQRPHGKLQLNLAKTVHKRRKNNNAGSERSDPMLWVGRAARSRAWALDYPAKGLAWGYKVRSVRTQMRLHACDRRFDFLLLLDALILRSCKRSRSFGICSKRAMVRSVMTLICWLGYVM